MKFNPCYAAQKILKIEEQAKEVCPAPWLHLDITPNGTYGPCCWYISQRGSGTDKIENLSSLWNSQFFQRLRHHVARGEYDLSGCNRNCYYLNNRLQAPFDPGWILESIPEAALEQQNFLSAIDEYKQLKIKLSSSPVVVHMGLSFKCDLGCIMCVQDHSLSVRIPESTIQTLAQYAGDFSIWALTGGEIFADPESYRSMEIVLAQKQTTLCVLIITNGVGLSAKRLSRIQEYDLPRIGFSIASLDREIYRHIHGYDMLDRVLENLKGALEVFRKRDASGNIYWRLVLMKSNLKSLPKVFELCKQHGILLELDTINGPFPEENVFNYANLLDEVSDLEEIKDWLETRRTDPIFVPYLARRTLEKLDQAIKLNRNPI